MLSALLVFAQPDGAKGAAADTPLGPFLQFAPLVFIVILFYFLIIAPARRKERQQRDMLNNSLKKNDRVLTNAGIIGTVANIKDEEVTLKLDEGRMRILKSTIARILGDEEPGKEAKSEQGKSS
jgi:preprotein translocase subunit YajC